MGNLLNNSTELINITNENREEQEDGEDLEIIVTEGTGKKKSIKKRRKLTGPDEITNAMLKYGGEVSIQDIKILLQKTIYQKNLYNQYNDPYIQEMSQISLR